MHIIEAYPNSTYSYPIYICSEIEFIFSYLQKHLRKYNKIILFIDAYIEKLECTNEIVETFKNYNLHNTEVIIFPLKPGKQSKSLQTIEKLAQWLLNHNVQRDSLFISVGGGVVGDLIGFLSSIYFRGVSLAHIPTNLLSMTDSAIGGKTAINTSCHVNTLGTYKHPVFIVIYTGFLESSSKGYFGGICRNFKSWSFKKRRFTKKLSI